MPTYTVKTDAGDGFDAPGEKMEFAHTKAATDDAQVALAEMAQETLPNGKTAHFGVEVEDSNGKQVYRAGLQFSAKNEDDIDREGQEADAAADDVASNLGGTGPRE